MDRQHLCAVAGLVAACIHATQASYGVQKSSGGVSHNYCITQSFSRRDALHLAQLLLAKSGTDSLASHAECNAELNVKRDALLSGDEEPYAWKGPSKECDTEGCNHPHWGRNCRQAAPHPLLDLQSSCTEHRMIPTFLAHP